MIVDKSVFSEFTGSTLDGLKYKIPITINSSLAISDNTSQTYQVTNSPTPVSGTV